MKCPQCNRDWHILYGRLHGRQRRKCGLCGYQYTVARYYERRKRGQPRET